MPQDDEFCKLKTLCREEIESLFIKALSSKRFHDNWQAIEANLLASGVPSLDVILIHTDCISYTSARDSREAGASTFSSAANAARESRKAEIRAQPHLRAIADFLIS